jgi:hypothetical protein
MDCHWLEKPDQDQRPPTTFRLVSTYKKKKGFRQTNYDFLLTSAGTAQAPREFCLRARLPVPKRLRLSPRQNSVKTRVLVTDPGLNQSLLTKQKRTVIVC